LCAFADQAKVKEANQESRDDYVSDGWSAAAQRDYLGAIEKYRRALEEPSGRSTSEFIHGLLYDAYRALGRPSEAAREYALSHPRKYSGPEPKLKGDAPRDVPPVCDFDPIVPSKPSHQEPVPKQQNPAKVPMSKYPIYDRWEPSPAPELTGSYTFDPKGGELIDLGTGHPVWRLYRHAFTPKGGDFDKPDDLGPRAQRQGDFDSLQFLRQGVP
jgi:tetratricopeptide (TPR) repeat protein